jgi:hypothetical protein
METISADASCPRCRKSRSEWRSDNSEGVRVSGVLYCCDGCAQDVPCTCALLQSTTRLEENVTKQEIPELQAGIEKGM